MRQQTKFALFFTGCLLLSAFAGCGKKQADTSSETIPVNQDSSVVDSENDGGGVLVDDSTKSDSDKKLIITVDTVEVTKEQLKEQDYIVPLQVRLEKNAGITYSEWGLSYDDRCEAFADHDGLNYGTVYAFSSDKPFLWTAWSSGGQIFEYTSPILNFYLKLPEDVGIGDFYPVTYESTSQANMPHKWSDGENDWVAMGAVGWSDDGVRVVVSAD